MIGLTFIDTQDLYLIFGIFIEKGGYSGLATFPPIKEPVRNDWQEEDGIEVDLSEPKLDSNQFEITFVVTDFANIDGFLAKLSDGAYHDFVFSEISLSRKLRLVSHSNNKVLVKLGRFSLKFADDFPLEGFVPDTPNENTLTGYEVDNIDFGQFGILVLEGEKEELSKSPEVKPNLLINTSNISGAIYDPNETKFQAKELTLKCLYRADLDLSWRKWWQNYYNFLNSLIQPYERTLYVPYQDNEHTFYYKSSSVDRFEIVRGKVWCEFSLNLVLIAYRVGIDKLLATENGEIIIINENKCAIDLNN